MRSRSLNRAASVAGLWYHGDTSKRSTFADQKMDRDPHVMDRNAMGPGIYWTRDKTQARGYAWPTGYVYSATMKRGTRVLEEGAAPGVAEVRKFIDLAPAESRATGLSNWDESPTIARSKAMFAYGRGSTDLHDALCGVYNDFYGQDAEAFAKSMVRLGYDVFLHHLPEVDHLIVYNPDVIQVVGEEWR